MVTFFPQKTSLGNEIGKGLERNLGPALQQGITQGANVGFQRGLLQNALGGLSNLPKNATPFELASQLMQATAGIPGAERYVGQLYPLLLAQLRGKSTGQGTGQGNEGAVSNGLPGDTQQGSGTQFQEQGGYLAAPLTQQEKLRYAENFGLGSPEDKVRGLQLANELSSGATKNLEDFQSRALGQGVTEKELPYFMQMAQLSKEKNPEKLLTNTLRDLEEIRALDNTLVPGIGANVFKPISGLIPSLLQSGAIRQSALKRLQPTIKNLVEKGYEPIIRDKLARLDLSPTEVEEVIHPFSEQLESKINSFPKATSNAETNKTFIKDFFKKNVTNGVSLLPLRHKLWKDKGYDWKQIVEGFNEARKEGLALNGSQSTELAEFSTQPPRDSLIDIFTNWGRPFDILKGKK